MRYASFFSGAGGLDLGLEQAGWECVYLNEFDRRACETLRANRPSWPLHEGDVREWDGNGVRQASGHVDAVVGGPPCQAFSTAGKRLGLNDERGNVFLHFLDIAIALRPRLIVIENVRGLLSAPLSHRPHSERGFGFAPLSPDELRGGALAHILHRLKGEGYGVSFDLYDTANFGVPQRRERLVLVAASDGSRPPHLLPTHCEHGPTKWLTFKDAVNGLSHVQEHSELRPNQRRYLEKLAAGQNWRDLPEKEQREALGKAFECSGGRTGFLRRLAWDKPAPTLMTSPTMPATLLAHPVDLRPLGVQEYARVQTFPDSWRFSGKTSDKYRLIGNAVPVRFARAVGEQIGGWSKGLRVHSAPASKSRYSETCDETWSTH
ncbi:MAG: DNA cytosine methyltransferase [Armatimonadetes bacterium]|nr:DNA cytosine methyltransferase [Armatimonadota bacterium]